MAAYLPYLRVAKAKTIAVIQVKEIYPIELCQGVLSQATLNTLDPVAQYSMDFDYTTFSSLTGPDSVGAWHRALDDVISKNVDALFICDYGDGSELALEYLRERNWLPKSLTLGMYLGNFKDASLLDYVTTIHAFDVNSRFPMQESFTDSAGYSRLVQQNYGAEVSDVMAKCTLSGMLYTNAISTANSNTSDELLASMSISQLASFMGTSAFDAIRRQTLSALVVQYTHNATLHHVIGPALAAADSLIYPMPTWSERVFNPKWEANGTEVASVVLICFGGVSSLAWALFLLIFWRNRVVYAASPLFLLTILIGSVLVYVSIFTWMPNLVSDSVCNLRAWLLPLGFMTMFGSLIAKTYRIHKLYNSRNVTILVIRNLRVALYILAIVGVQAVISVLMVAVTKLGEAIHVVDPYRVSYNYKVCTFTVALKVLFAINVVYAFLLLVWGSYLAYRIRKVPISMYDESKVIAFSIYNTAFFGIIVICIQLAVGNSNRHLTFMVTAVCCFLGAFITVTCLFVAKVWAIRRPQRSSHVRDTTSSNSTGSTLEKSAGHLQSSIRDAKPRPAVLPRTEAEAKSYMKKCKKLRKNNRNLELRILHLEALARDNGFLAHSEEEGKETPV